MIIETFQQIKEFIVSVCEAIKELIPL